MGARGLLDAYLEGREAIEIVADGDMDGVVAAALLASCLKARGIRVSVFLPKPFDKDPRPGAIIVERCERLGPDGICIDHHADGDEGYVTGSTGTFRTGRRYGSVARLVYEMFQGEPCAEGFEEYVEVADAVDSMGPDAVEVLREPEIYWGYRLAIGKVEWRRFLEENIPSDPLGALRNVFDLFRMVGGDGDAIERIAEILSLRAETRYTESGRSVAILFVEEGEFVRKFPIIGAVDLGLVATRNVQSRLGRTHDYVVIITRRAEGLGASIYTRHGDANRVAEAAVDRGIAGSGGGRANVAGVQNIAVEPEEFVEVLLEIIG